MAQLQSPWYARHRTGFIIARSAEGISQVTVRDYTRGSGYFGV